jgi:hypothetical protein
MNNETIDFTNKDKLIRLLNEPENRNNFKLKCEIAKNSQTPVEVLEAILEDTDDWDVIEEILKNPKAPKQIKENIIDTIVPTLQDSIGCFVLQHRDDILELYRAQGFIKVVIAAGIKKGLSKILIYLNLENIEYPIETELVEKAKEVMIQQLGKYGIKVK